MRRLALLLLSALLLVACGAALPAGPVERIETGVDPETWARIPAGPFLLGQHEEQATIDADYEMMATTVTNAQYADYLNQALAAGSVKLAEQNVVGFYPGDTYGGVKHEERIDPGDYLHVPLAAPELRLLFDGQRFAALPGYENHPMVMVTWFGARAYCEAAGGHLPSQMEWEKAARGTDNRPYPWGDTLARNQANYYNSRDIIEKVAGKGGDTTPVGFYNGKTYDDYQTLPGTSPYGLYDMAGNVWQWTGDITPGIHYRFMRGGSKADYGYMLRVWARNNARPDYYSTSVGFRCARPAR